MTREQYKNWYQHYIARFGITDTKITGKTKAETKTTLHELFEYGKKDLIVRNAFILTLRGAGTRQDVIKRFKDCAIQVEYEE